MATAQIKISPPPADFMPTEMRELRNFNRMTAIWENHLNKDAAIGACLTKQDSAFWEMICKDGITGGLYYATEIIAGVRAGGNIVIWNQYFYGRTKMHRQMMRYVFQVYDLQRMQATCFVDNIPSQKFQERIGFTRECTMRNYGFRDGVLSDAIQYAITREDLF